MRDRLLTSAGAPADARADLYALGVILQDAGHFRRIARRCLQADPSRRYTSAREMEKALRRESWRWIWLLLVVLAALAGALHRSLNVYPVILKVKI